MTRTANERERAPLKRARVNLVMPPAPLTVIEVCHDVAPGNTLYIRGQDDGVRFRLLLNDRIWAKGRDIIVEAGANATSALATRRIRF